MLIKIEIVDTLNSQTIYLMQHYNQSYYSKNTNKINMKSQLRIKLDGYNTKQDYFTTLPGTPNSTNKRFSRKRQTSNQSIKSIKNLYTKNKDLSLHLETNKHDRQQHKHEHSKKQMLDLIADTSYIPTSRKNSYTSIDTQTNKNKVSRMKQGLELDLKTRKQQNCQITKKKQEYVRNNVSSYRLITSNKCKPLQISIKLNQHQKNIEANTTNTNSIHPKKHNNQQNLLNKLKVLEQQNEIKSSQLLILCDKYDRLKMQDGNKKKMIIRLNQQIDNLNKNNNTIKQSMKGVYTEVQRIVGEYFHRKLMNKYRQNNIINTIQQFQGLLVHYIEDLRNTYQNIIDNLKTQLKQTKQYINKLQIQKHCSNRYKQYYEQIQQNAIKNTQQLRKLDRRYKILSVDYEDLRNFNNRLKKVNIQLKTQIQLLYKQTKNVNNPQYQTTQNSFILGLVTHQKMMPINSRILSQLNNQSNNSLNISDISTDEQNLLENL